MFVFRELNLVLMPLSEHKGFSHLSLPCFFRIVSARFRRIIGFLPFLLLKGCETLDTLLFGDPRQVSCLLLGLVCQALLLVDPQSWG